MTEIGEYHVARGCEHRGRLRACRRPLLGQCQYCGGGFCAAHGERFGEKEEVCIGTPCQQKKADLARHVVYRADAQRRNGATMCGDPACEAPPRAACQRCRAHYCVDHLRQHLLGVRRRGEIASEVVRLCLHCSERRRIWEPG